MKASVKMQNMSQKVKQAELTEPRMKLLEQTSKCSELALSASPKME